MSVDYSHNHLYRQTGTTNPVVSRCVCGHVLEWHYRLRLNDKGTDMGFAFRALDANRCPSNTCDCSTPKWDGQEPAKLPNLLATERDAETPAA